jgi:hypothetical protein
MPPAREGRRGHGGEAAGGIPEGTAGVFGLGYFTSSIFLRLVKALAPSMVFASMR